MNEKNIVIDVRICIPAQTATEAYARLPSMLRGLPAGVAWESGTNWYEEDDNGARPLTAEEMMDARNATWQPHRLPMATCAGPSSAPAPAEAPKKTRKKAVKPRKKTPKARKKPVRSPRL